MLGIVGKRVGFVPRLESNRCDRRNSGRRPLGLPAALPTTTGAAVSPSQTCWGLEMPGAPWGSWAWPGLTWQPSSSQRSKDAGPLLAKLRNNLHWCPAKNDPHEESSQPPPYFLKCCKGRGGGLYHLREKGLTRRVTQVGTVGRKVGTEREQDDAEAAP